MVWDLIILLNSPVFAKKRIGIKSLLLCYDSFGSSTQFFEGHN